MYPLIKQGEPLPRHERVNGEITNRFVQGSQTKRPEDIAVRYAGTNALKGIDQLKEIDEVSRDIGQAIDANLILDTPEAMVEIQQLVDMATQYRITCNLGTQIHHIFEADPKSFKGVTFAVGDREEVVKFFKKHQEIHWEHCKEKKVITSLEERIV